MTIAPPFRILGAAVILALLLVGVVVRENQARSEGVEARLPMQGVDPRSLLSGHYVALNLDQTILGSDCPPGTETENGWIALTQASEALQVTGAGKSRDAAARLGTIVIKGTVTCTMGRPLTRTLVMDVGIRRLHINQTDALAIERRLRGAREAPAFAIVSVGKDGKARLKGVVVEGQRTDLSWF